VGIKNRQRKCQRKKYAGQPGCELHQYIGRLRTENIFRDPGAKRRAQTFALGPLHQDHKHHKQADEHKERQAEID